MTENVIRSGYIGDRLKDVTSELLSDTGFRTVWQSYGMAVQIARVIAEMRKRAGLTQVELAKRVNVKQPFVARLESEKPEKMPTLETIARVANACGYHLSVVLTKEPRSETEQPLFELKLV